MFYSCVIGKRGITLNSKKFQVPPTVKVGGFQLQKMRIPGGIEEMDVLIQNGDWRSLSELKPLSVKRTHWEG